MKLNVMALAAATGAFGALVVVGFFLAFSALVMRSLDRVSPEVAIEAMQSINVVAVRCLLMPAMFGTAVLALLLGATAVGGVATAWRSHFIVGATVYLVGTIGVTMAFNVPANNGLADVTASAPNASAIWAAYSPGWTVWNHVRTIAAGIAGVAFAWGSALIWIGERSIQS